MKLAISLTLLVLAGLALPWQSPAAVRAQSAAYGISHVIILPTPPGSFDIGFVDPSAHRYYIASSTHAAVEIFDTTTDTYVGAIGGFAGLHPERHTSGPTGVLVTPDTHQLWAGDGDSTVKVIDTTTNTIIATISTGGMRRADELAYDPIDHLIAVANDDEEPPFLTLISTTTLKVTAKILFAEGTEGLEQPVWDPASGLFYQAVPATKVNSGGEVDVIDPKTAVITQVYPVTNCNPAGLALGPNRQLLLGCTGDPRNSIVMDDTNGAIVATISEVGGSDEVWYNPTDNHYYLAASGMTSDGTKKGTSTPVLGVIDAASNRWLINVPTVTGSHSVAVDPTTNHIFMPIAKVGIGVYTAASSDNQ